MAIIKSNRSVRLNGLNPLAYIGQNSYTPPDYVIYQRDPTVNDWQDFYVGCIWLNQIDASATHNVWMLVSKQNNQALWIQFIGGSGTITALKADDGNIANPNAGKVNVFGDTRVTTTADNVNTLTVHLSGSIASLYTEDVGSAVPLLGNLNVLGTANNITTSGAGNTITINIGSHVATSYPTDSGTAVPAAGVLNVFGGTAGRDINTTGSGNTIHVELNNAITVGDLSNLGAGVAAVTATTGDITLSATNNVGNINLPNTHSSGNAGIITFGGTGSANRFIHNFGTNNTFVGHQAGNVSLTVGSSVGNTALGIVALDSLTTGGENVAIGGNVLDTCNTGSQNTIAGTASAVLLTTGSRNSGFGYQCLVGISTANTNTALGYTAGSQLGATDSSNIMIRHNGLIGDNNTIRIGTNGAGDSQQNKCFIAGIRGITTGIADAVAVLIDSGSQLGTVSSSLRHKENVKDMSSLSDNIYKLRPVVFNYKSQEDKKRSYGLIAEEIHEVMPDLVVYKDGEPETVKYHELPVILLNEIQKLAKRIEMLEKKLEQS